MPSTLIKVSGLIDDHQETILNEFITVHQCSKAKAMGLLLNLWSEQNRPKIETEDTIKKSELLSIIDERIKAIIPNLVTNLNSNNTTNFVTNLNNESETKNKDSNLITNSTPNINNHDITNSVTNLDSDDRNITTNFVTNSELDSDNFEIDNQIDNNQGDITEDNTLSESPRMPLKEDKGDNEQLFKELTESQQKVMSSLDNIPSGEKLCYSKLAEILGVSRTVLDSFTLWHSHFQIVEKKRGCDYIKL